MNAASATRRPFAPIHRAQSKFVNNVPIPHPTESTWGYIFKPVILCQMNSFGPPIWEATTGLPAAQPSSAVMPKGSLRLGRQTASHAL